MSGADAPLAGSALTDAISEEMAALYARVYGHHRTVAKTFIARDVVVCILENVFTRDESRLVAEGAGRGVIDRRVAFQSDSEDDFTEAVERLTGRTVAAFMSANQTSPGVASELFMLDPLEDAA